MPSAADIVKRAPAPKEANGAGCSSKREEELERELERMKLEMENLKKAAKPKFEVTWKISEKGALAVYGLGRFPTTLYAQQWQRLLERADDILDFIQENKDKLSFRP